MDPFDYQLMLEFFLETDSISTLNRVAVAASGIAQEQSEILGACRTAIKRYCDIDEDTKMKRKKRSLGIHQLPKFSYKNLLDRYTNTQYEERFKMKRSTVKKLITYLNENVQTANSQASLEKKLHVYIWLLTSGCSYSEVGSIFKIHKSSVSYILHEMSSILANLRYDFIKWPSTEEQQVTIVKISSRLKFPNCVGFIDACRLKVGSKITKKNEPEIVLLQAVCDETLKFISVHVGNVGETRKNKVYKESPLSKELKNNVEFENHILGDSSYRLKNNLMTPFNSSEVLTREEMNYNDIHWKTRAFIGTAFGLLRDKFKKLNHIDLNKPEAINTMVTAACVLHNFVLLHEPVEEIVKSEVLPYAGVNIDREIVQNALEKRQFLCNYVNYLDETENEDVMHLTL